MGKRVEINVCFRPFLVKAVATKPLICIIRLGYSVSYLYHTPVTLLSKPTLLLAFSIKASLQPLNLFLCHRVRIWFHPLNTSNTSIILSACYAELVSAPFPSYDVST